jgi:hypothetical protein
MSFKISGCAYNAGLMNPIGFLLTLSRASLIRLMIEAKMGVLALVPPERLKFPAL